MGDSKKIMRAIMVGIVLTAVVVGMLYYYHDTQDKSMSGNGTLIAVPSLGWYAAWRE